MRVELRRRDRVRERLGHTGVIVRLSWQDAVAALDCGIVHEPRDLRFFSGL
jgi:hypothetical protein